MLLRIEKPSVLSQEQMAKQLLDVLKAQNVTVTDNAQKVLPHAFTSFVREQELHPEHVVQSQERASLKTIAVGDVLASHESDAPDIGSRSVATADFFKHAFEAGYKYCHPEAIITFVEQLQQVQAEVSETIEPTEVIVAIPQVLDDSPDYVHMLKITRDKEGALTLDTYKYQNDPRIAMFSTSQRFLFSRTPEPISQ